MGDYSSIEWTDATWNPTTGCTRLTRGCDNCYAHALAHGRLEAVYLRQLPVIQSAANLADPFAVRTWPERLEQPGKWRESRMIFVNSMSDLFHVDVPEAFLLQIFHTMLEVDRHVYQVLTKRPARAAQFFAHHPELLTGAGVLPEHIWIGTSVEDQDVAYRIRHLLAVPAAVRFLSCEPLLGHVELDLNGIHWVIAGGESGIGYRPMDPSWVRSIRDQSVAQGVPFFFKQWGGRTPKAKGRMLDGRTWDEMPAYLQVAA
jgi:protein gp37